MEVPRALDAAGQSSWVDARAEELRERWAADWREEWEASVRHILEIAVTTRASDVVLDALCWPISGPALARVVVRVGPATSLSPWREAGFEVDSYSGARLGPGVQCIDRTVTEAHGERVGVVVAHYLFGDGDHTVQVTVEPTFAQVFTNMLPGLQGFLDSLDVRSEEGQPFRAVPCSELAEVSGEEWKGWADG